MKIAPLRTTDPWFHRLVRHRKAETQSLRTVPCDIAVRMEHVSILHHGPDQNYRPYLHLRGHLVSVLPDVALPFGITELPFHSGIEPNVDAFYEFDVAQLSELVRKGYFGTRFRVPETMVGIVWELPAEADFLVVSPEDPDKTEQPPLVFVDVHDQNSSVLTEESSGYALAEYFPDFSVEETVQASTENEHSVPTHSGVIQDLFAQEEFEEFEPHQPVAPAHPVTDEGQAGQTPVGIFDRIIDEVEAQQRAQAESHQPGVDYDQHSPAGVLRDRILPGVQQALSGSEQSGLAQSEAERGQDEAVRSIEVLDLGGEPEPGMAPEEAQVSETSEHGSGAERQEEADDYQPGT